MVILKAGACSLDSSVSCPSPKGSTAGPKWSRRDPSRKMRGRFQSKKQKRKTKKQNRSDHSCCLLRNVCVDNTSAAAAARARTVNSLTGHSTHSRKRNIPCGGQNIFRSKHEMGGQIGEVRANLAMSTYPVLTG